MAEPNILLRNPKTTIGVLLLVTFALDLVAPAGLAVWSGYVLPVIVAARLDRRWAPFLIAGIGAALLLIVGFVLSTSGDAHGYDAGNRMLGILLLLAVAALARRP